MSMRWIVHLSCTWGLVLFVSPASGTEVLIDDFLTNGSVSIPSIDISSGSPGPTNRAYTGLGTNAIGDRTTILSAPDGVSAGNYAYVESTGGGTALFYNIGSTASNYSRHQISWALGGFNLLSAVGAGQAQDVFFQVGFGSDNFMTTASQVFNIYVTSPGGEGVYSVLINSNQVDPQVGFTNSFTFTGQSGDLDATDVSTIRLEADLPFTGEFTQFKLTGVSVVPEPSTFALFGVSALAAALFSWRRRK